MENKKQGLAQDPKLSAVVNSTNTVNLVAGTLHASEDIASGMLYAGDDIYPGTLHGESQSNPFGVVKVAFSPEAFEQMKNTIGSKPAETGGALFGEPADLRSAIPYIKDFVFDAAATSTWASYTINTEFLNPVIHEKWDNHGLEIHGLVHSHPKGCKRLSMPDMEYFRNMHTYMDRPFLITPIILTQPDGGFELFCYLVGPDPQMPAIKVDYCIMNEEEYKKAISELNAERTENTDETQQEESAKDIEPDTQHSDARNAIDYSREEGAVDVELLKKSKMVIVGTGGFYEGANMLARCGVGEIITIDPDIVDNTNLCRQGYLPRQVGMNKVDALGECVKEINPELNYRGYAVKLQELTPEQEEEIFSSATLAIFTTDSFDAQAYGNKIALKYQIPAIWGGFYKDSLFSEIVFYIPNVTPGCFRCAVSPRYKYNEEYKAQHGTEYHISSACNTIFHSALLDAQMGMLAMAIIHNNVEGKTFSGWFGEKFDKSIIQMKVNPKASMERFDHVFEKVEGDVFTFHSRWQQNKRETPPDYDTPCPDCCGNNAPTEPDNGK